MAEAAGLAVGVLGLVGVFKDCIDLFSYFSAHRSFGRDYEVLETKLLVEKVLLLQWAHRVRLVRPNYDRRLDEPDINSTITRILAGIQYLLSESSQFEGRYGLRESHEPTLSSRMDRMSTVRMKHFLRDFEKLQINMAQRLNQVSMHNRLRWIIVDKEKFEKLVRELSHFVARLNHVLPETGHAEQRDTSKVMVKEDISNLKDLEVLQLTYDAISNRQRYITEAVDECIHEQKILDRLWFRSIDDRRDGVAIAHHETLQWVLNPQNENMSWDDFPAWLQSTGRLYWVSGKAGSGKSTLMKYLYHHQKTLELSSNWAGSMQVFISSFFFWNLGTPEQRSLSGLQRAVLYRILDVQRDLVPKLLPTMWQESHRRNGAELDMPTDSELSLAFEKLVSQECALSKCFCFFIDGLDEFVGDHRQGALFIKRLVKNPQIKAVVSSRPIPPCVDAFSATPTLQLQNLTRGDITNYVQATVGSHPYMVNLLALNSIDSNSIIDELIRKASGVFLWVVLACRSVIDGFAAYDNIQELCNRVDELPPELEDLFQHMLDRVEPRYHDEMARMLKICYQRQIPCGTNIKLIPTLAWAILDNFKLDRENSGPSLSLEKIEKNAICAPIEGRLRSRCGGLLEIKQHTYLCLCRSNPHDVLVDSTIEFMHRTMFEFLDNPDTWQRKSLRIQDPGFDPNTALSIMSIQIARLCLSTGDQSHRGFLLDAGLCARSADEATKDGCLIILIRLKEIARMFLRREQSPLTETPSLYSWPSNQLLLTEGCQPNEWFRDTQGLRTTPWRDWLRQMHRMDRAGVFEALETTEEFIRGGADLKANGLEPVDQMINRHLKSISSLTSEGRELQNKAARFLDFMEEIKIEQSSPCIPPSTKEKKRTRTDADEEDEEFNQKGKIRKVE